MYSATHTEYFFPTRADQVARSNQDLSEDEGLPSSVLFGYNQSMLKQGNLTNKKTDIDKREWRSELIVKNTEANGSFILRHIVIIYCYSYLCSQSCTSQGITSTAVRKKNHNDTPYHNGKAIHHSTLFLLSTCWAPWPQVTF
jgi:hypothetical protein